VGQADAEGLDWILGRVARTHRARVVQRASRRIACLGPRTGRDETFDFIELDKPAVGQPLGRLAVGRVVTHEDVILLDIDALNELDERRAPGRVADREAVAMVDEQPAPRAAAIAAHEGDRMLLAAAELVPARELLAASACEYGDRVLSDERLG
jgi:hypothetical protein